MGYPLQLYLAPEYKAWCEQNQIEFTLSSWQGVDNEGNISRYSFPERTFFEEIAPSHRKKANELVFMDCSYDVMLDNPITRVLMADVLTLTGRIRNLSPTAWQVGSGPGRWSVAGYITRIGRRKQWVRELRTSPPDCRVPPNGELEFALPIDTRGLPAGIYEVWIDMLMDGRNWMALHGAVPATAILRIETFSHEIAVDADAVTVSPGGTAVLSGTLRNTCGKPWPEGAGGEPLQLGARLFRQSAKGEAVREFRASPGATAGDRRGRGRLPPGVRSRRAGARRLRAQHRCREGGPVLAGREGGESQGHPGGDRVTLGICYWLSAIGSCIGRCSLCFRIHWLMSTVNVQPAMNSSRDVGTGTGSGLAVGCFTFAISAP